MTITESTDDQLMCMAAHRYCLGRQSYIVGSCLDWLRAHWAQFARNTRLVILRDTLEALMDDRAGSPTIDAPGWRAFAAWAWDESAGRLDDDDRAWVRSAVAHRIAAGKAWPLDEGEGGNPADRPRGITAD